MDDGPLNTATLYGLPFAVSPKKALQVATWQFARLGNLKERSRGLVGLPDEVP